MENDAKNADTTERLRNRKLIAGSLSRLDEAVRSLHADHRAKHYGPYAGDLGRGGHFGKPGEK